MHITKLLGLAGVFAAAMLLAQPASAQIANTKHNLATTSSNTTESSGTEICVFCHTPHGASNSAPLWNRGAPATGSFSLYTSASMQGTAIQPGASSKLCLSCHDGATALDLIINAPGSGGYNATGLSAGYTWSGVSGTNLMLSTSIATLGTDLSNDHPISIPYCGGQTVASTCNDLDFFTNKIYKNGTAGTNINGLVTDFFWIDTAGGTTGVRDKTDVPLYVATYTAGTQAGVECGSCHEPHGGAASTPFLRIANTGSALCIACHNK